MPTDTDIRLRSYLDANQRDREQLSRSILSILPKYTDVRPRHPLGGPDGGRDIEAVYELSNKIYGAVGFVNSANDSNEQVRDIEGKFKSDLSSAKRNGGAEVKGFVFITNIRLTMGKQSTLKAEAYSEGFTHCDILDRERLRIELDSPAGLFARFQYLGIPLSDAEQASFLERYGDRIQEAVSTGFKNAERDLSRLIFLQESQKPLRKLHIVYILDREYRPDEIGHFRAFADVFLRTIPNGVIQIYFGASDKSDRFREDIPPNKKNTVPGIGSGVGHSQWEVQFDDLNKSKENEEDSAVEPDDDTSKWVQVGSASSIGMNSVRAVVTSFSHNDGMLRVNPRIALSDLEDAWLMPVMDESFASKLSSIRVQANGYVLLSIEKDEFNVDNGHYETTQRDFSEHFPGDFTDEELEKRWVKIRPSQKYGLGSSFQFDFFSKTPRRVMSSDILEVKDN